MNFNFGNVINSNIVLKIGTQEANAVQNQANKEIERLREPDDTPRKEVVMYWHQVKKGDGVSGGRTGDKAVIEVISDSPLSVYFSESMSWIKEKMTGQENNPLKKAYIVDVDVIKVKSRLVGYRITNLHGELELDPQPEGSVLN